MVLLVIWRAVYETVECSMNRKEIQSARLMQSHPVSMSSAWEDEPNILHTPSGRGSRDPPTEQAAGSHFFSMLNSTFTYL